MKIALFFHLYQPPTQFQEVTRSIVRSCYLPLFSLIRKYPAVRLTINTPASFWEQVTGAGAGSLQEDLVAAVRSGRVELTQTAAFHPLLTKISTDEVKRQVCLNRESLRGVLGGDFVGAGFFPPEMAYNERVGEVLAELGMRWVLLDEIHKSRDLPGQFFKTRQGLTAVFRNSEGSLALAFGKVKTAVELADRLAGGGSEETVLALDGETFGHHLPWGMDLLEDIFKLSGSRFELVTVSDICPPLVDSPPEADSEVAALREATWATTPEGLAGGILYPHWDLPGNEIHKMQWELLDLAVETVENSKLKSQNSNLKLKTSNLKDLRLKDLDLTFDIYDLTLSDEASFTPDQIQWFKARKLLDKALHSDQFWWASHNPNWHLGMVKRGARMLADVVLTLPDAGREDIECAQELYDKIVETGGRLYGDTIVE